MRIITTFEVVYTLFLNQAGVDNVADICENEEEQAQRLMNEAIGELGIDRTEVGAACAVRDITELVGQWIGACGMWMAVKVLPYAALSCPSPAYVCQGKFSPWPPPKYDGKCSLMNGAPLMRRGTPTSCSPTVFTGPNSLLSFPCCAGTAQPAWAAA